MQIKTSEIPSCSGWQSSRKQTTNAWENVGGGKEAWYTGDGNVNYCNQYGNQYGGSSKKPLQINLPYDTFIPLLGI
jgi:hypothetical protein